MKMNYNKDQFYELLQSGHFANMVKESVKNQMVQNSTQVYNIMKPLVEQENDVEQFWVLYLDSKNKILEISCMSKGSITSTMIYPREIIKKVLSVKAAGIVCCHNHPSGDPIPSTEDQSLTFQLVAACISVGIDMHEHIIIGNSSYYSFADIGTIARLKREYKSFIQGR